MKILFQGDSITDAGRSREDPHLLGGGYPKFTAQLIKERYPTEDFEFVNYGVSGDRAESLLARWDRDAIAVQPDVVSILIGINDTWHHSANKDWMDNGYYENCYRTILAALKEKTAAKIIILEQFLLHVDDKDFFHVDLDPKIQITRKLAREFADAFIPLDGLFAAASVGTPPTHWAGDGVHPSEAGAKFIAAHYLEAFGKIK
jgi:lysophospholipase L1-like esterase